MLWESVSSLSEFSHFAQNLLETYKKNCRPISSVEICISPVLLMKHVLLDGYGLGLIIETTCMLTHNGVQHIVFSSHAKFLCSLEHSRRTMNGVYFHIKDLISFHPRVVSLYPF